jgi:hypothetical protein
VTFQTGGLAAQVVEFSRGQFGRHIRRHAAVGGCRRRRCRRRCDVAPSSRRWNTPDAADSAGIDLNAAISAAVHFATPADAGGTVRRDAPDRRVDDRRFASCVVVVVVDVAADASTQWRKIVRRNDLVEFGARRGVIFASWLERVR